MFSRCHDTGHAGDEFEKLAGALALAVGSKNAFSFPEKQKPMADAAPRAISVHSPAAQVTIFACTVIFTIPFPVNARF